MGRTREEHLAWAKERAIELLEAGDLAGAAASMVSDLKKHEGFDPEVVDFMGGVALLFEIQSGPQAVRRWIEGFN